MSNLSKITAAHTAYVRAVEGVAAAEYARDDAYNAFEQAIATVGWTRLRGAFSATATPLYQSLLYETSLTAEQVLQVLGQQARAAA